MNDKQEKRLSEIPDLYKANYQKAMTTKSKAAAIKAKCLDCCCWMRAEITECGATACPLYPHRPYRVKSAKPSETPPQNEELTDETAGDGVAGEVNA